MLAKHQKEMVQPFCVDKFCEAHQIFQLNMLHSDIQGFEYLMLQGAEQMLKREAIDYIFLSSHSQELHETCVQYLTDHNYQILASADLQETYSFDGLIVAKRKSLIGPNELAISKKPSSYASHFQD